MCSELVIRVREDMLRQTRQLVAFPTSGLALKTCRAIRKRETGAAIQANPWLRAVVRELDEVIA